MTIDDTPRRTQATGSERWDRIQQLFHGAVELAAAEQRTFLAAQCPGDDGLIADVLALLAEDARGGSPLDRGVADVASAVLATGTQRLVADQLGPYRILGLLGEGGMGVVYLAERTDVGSLVAIKLLSDAGLSPARAQRFASEQRVLAQLEHQTIARLYDAGALDDGTPYFVMEYVDGKSLTAHCRDHAATLPDRLALFRALCDAVQFAHRHAIIHRDIKPTNVLVKRDGSLRLLDFGIAKHLEDVDAPIDQTRTGLRLMTPAYAAPEQLRGEPVGIYTDVYSLGVVLYELLAGRLPFERSARAGLGYIADAEPERPSTAARASGTGATASRAAWADLDVLVLGAMHPEPQRRYRSVDAVIRDIDHYLAGEPLEARPDSVGYRLRKFLTRNWRSVAVAGAAFAAVVGLVGFFTFRLATARDAAVAEAVRVQRLQGFMVDLLTGGDAEAGPDKDLRVVTILERGAKQASALDRDPATQVALFQTLGRLFQARGELDRADALLRPAVAEQAALSGTGSVDTIEPLVALGELRAEQAKYAEAEALLQQAVAIGQRALAPDDHRSTQAKAALAALFTRVNRLPEAIALLDEVVRLQSAMAVRPRGISDNLTLLADAEFYLGHYTKAEALNQRALVIARQDYGAHHPNVAENLYNLGTLQLQWGHPDKGEPYYREALAIAQDYYGRDHVQTAEALTMLSRALGPQHKLDEQEAVLTESLAIRERAYGAHHPKIASTLSDVASVALWRGRLDDAEALHRRAEAIYHEAYGDKHYLVAIAHGNVANIYLERKDYATAQRLFEEALAMLRKTLPADHTLVAEAELRVGRTLLLQKRYADAEPHTRAGYTILANGGKDTTWFASARQDLAAIYDALGEPDRATPFRQP